MFQHPKVFSSEYYLVEVLWDFNVSPDFAISLRTERPVDDSLYSDFGVMRYMFLGKISTAVSLVAKWGKAELETWPLVVLDLHIPLLKLWNDCPVEGDEDLRTKQSLDFVYAYYPVSLTNGPRHSAQPDVFISKADTFNQNGWISEILGVSSFPLSDSRERVSPRFVQSREISADSFTICYNWSLIVSLYWFIVNFHQLV
ncbi:hypothetical protein V6N11_038596 [Hibiscus sabdariffa]|uniref:Uncharacterized protein n=1 Tax=Hibiscus sabdariffa TaxID=183260 RepID=A0ABR2SKQ1_9ROSI